MSPPDTEVWEKARRARDYLAEQLLSHPEVTLIDISTEGEKGKPTEQFVIRVHVRQPIDKQALGLPDKVNGFLVRVILGDYHPSSLG